MAQSLETAMLADGPERDDINATMSLWEFERHSLLNNMKISKAA
jgi:hypothetical protein